MKICVIGHTGFIGKPVYDYFKKTNDVWGINRSTKDIPEEIFDLTINCAGNSKKYIAEQNASRDFSDNIGIFSKILKLKTKGFIHISSIDSIFSSNSYYSSSKWLSENIVRLYFPKFMILRLGGVIGLNLMKNVVYDIVTNKDLFVTFNSKYNFILNTEISLIIEKAIKNNNMWSKYINVAANDVVKVRDIINIARENNIVFNGKEGTKYENYDNINIDILESFFKTQNSKYYIKKYIKEINNNG